METKAFDFIIIGAGPAGLAAAQYASRANVRTLLIDESIPGGQVLNIFNFENYPGLFPSVTGTQFVENAKQQALAFGATIIQTGVSSVDKIRNDFILETRTGSFSAPTLLLATGAEHRKLGVPGEKEFAGRGVSYCATCDGPFFRNKNIVVVGGGDSACDEASYLATLSTHVTMVHRKSQFRAQKAVADRVLRNQNITVKFNTTVSEIVGENKVTGLRIKDLASGEESLLAADGVFIFVGMIPRTALFETVPVDEQGYIKTDEDMHTIIPGLFAAGDVRSKSFRQVVTACADGAIAANEAAKYIRSLKNEVYK
jgi:thioredoxin reductase (NADPH)